MEPYLEFLWKNMVQDSVHILLSRLNEHLVGTEGCSNCGWEITEVGSSALGEFRCVHLRERVLQWVTPRVKGKDSKSANSASMQRWCRSQRIKRTRWKVFRTELAEELNLMSWGERHKCPQCVQDGGKKKKKALWQVMWTVLGEWLDIESHYRPEPKNGFVVEQKE